VGDIVLRCQWGTECTATAKNWRQSKAAPITGRRVAILDENTGRWSYAVCGRHKTPRKWGDASAHLAKQPAGCWHWTCTVCPRWTQRTGCRADLELAVTALAEHQKAEHQKAEHQKAEHQKAEHQKAEHTDACPDCGGCGYDVNFDGTDNGACLRCKGWGVDLTTTKEAAR
jgi:hypothetical protein